MGETMKLRWNEELKKYSFAFVYLWLYPWYCSTWDWESFEPNAQGLYDAGGRGSGKCAAALPPGVGRELLQLLDQPETTGEGEALLARYGIFTEYGSRTLEGKEKRLHFFVLGMNLFLAGILALGAGGILIYLRRRQQRIRELQHYMERLSRGITAWNWRRTGMTNSAGCAMKYTGLRCC